MLTIHYFKTICPLHLTATYPATEFPKQSAYPMKQHASIL